MKSPLRAIFNHVKETIQTHFELHEMFPREFWRSDTSNEIKNWLEGQGWSYIGQGAYSRAFRSPDNKWVLKFSFDEVNQVSKDQLKLYPLLARRLIKPIFSHRNVIVQPAADTSNYNKIKKATDILAKWFYKLYENDFDCHSLNVGYYKGKLMTFDPMVND